MREGSPPRLRENQKLKLNKMKSSELKKVNVKQLNINKMENVINQKNKKGFSNELNGLLKSNGITVEILKYKNFKIQFTPTSLFPEMVTIVRSVSGLKQFTGKKFVNLNKIKIFIDTEMSELYLKKGVSTISKELDSVRLSELNWE